MALVNGHSAVVIFLLQNGSQGAEGVLATAAQSGDLELVNAALAAGPPRQALVSALAIAEGGKRTALVPVIKAAIDARPPEPPPPTFALDPATFPKYAGAYRDEPRVSAGHRDRRREGADA